MADAREARAVKEKANLACQAKLDAEQDARIRKTMASLRAKMEQIRRQGKDGEE